MPYRGDRRMDRVVWRRHGEGGKLFSAERWPLAAGHVHRHRSGGGALFNGVHMPDAASRGRSRGAFLARFHSRREASGARHAQEEETVIGRRAW